MKGKVALITGCTLVPLNLYCYYDLAHNWNISVRAGRIQYRGGIGRATALRLARLGCDIAVHYNSAAAVARSLVLELISLSVRADAFQADLSTYDGVNALHADVVKKLGPPDVLFCNAGATLKTIGPQGDILDVSPEEFERT